MNTSTQHPPRPSDTPQEGNVPVVQTPFTPSPEALRVKDLVDKMAERVGGFIENLKEQQRQMEETEHKLNELSDGKGPLQDLGKMPADAYAGTKNPLRLTPEERALIKAKLQEQGITFKNKNWYTFT